MALDYPKIRYVDVIPIETHKGQMIGLRDPIGVAPEMLLISPDIFYLLRFFDGNHSKLDLRYKYMQAFGQFLYEEQLSHILTNLNTNFFLENENYHNRLAAIENEFKEQPIRPAFHAGQCYEANPTKLKQQIDAFFSSPEGAGYPRQNVKKCPIKGLIAPHIDLRAGGACYSYAYKSLAESDGAECFVILGTGHSGLHNLYSTLAKDFETPFGRARCDFELIDLLKTNYSGDANSEILAHKSEHTIEFQLVFLQHLYQEKNDFTFVPILCSFSYHMLNREQFPQERKIIDDFISALKKTIKQIGKKVCLIASVDLSHVGPRYGDREKPDQAFMQRVTKVDQEILKTIERLDSVGFHQTIEKQEDRFRVCGYSSIYTLLNVIDAEKGRLLNYSKTEVDAQHSTVTFASMDFK
ncbi:MAG: AmmeMemoRadiSam system protein B [bacterium]